MRSMYCMSPPSSLSRLRRTRRRGIDSEPLLPGEQRVVDLERAGSNLDRPSHALRRDPRLGVPERAVQRLGRAVRVAHGEPQAVVTARHGLAFGGECECARYPAPAMLDAHLDV